MSLAMAATRQAMQQVLQLHLPGNLAAENRRLTAEVQRLQQLCMSLERQQEITSLAKDEAVDAIKTMYIHAAVNSVKLDRYLSLHIKPRMRSKADVKWLAEASELDHLIQLHRHEIFERVFGMFGHEAFYSFQDQVRLAISAENDKQHLDWAFIAPDFDNLRQIREQGDAFYQTGLVIHYDNNGLAQAPRQEAMI